MKIPAISCDSSVKSATKFNGLWGDRVYSHNRSNSQYDCDYYVQTYYPFSNESKAEIYENTTSHLDELNKVENVGEDIPNYIVSCESTSVKIGPRLSITKEDYENLQQGKLPYSIIKIEKMLQALRAKKS